MSIDYIIHDKVASQKSGRYILILKMYATIYMCVYSVLGFYGNLLALLIYIKSTIKNDDAFFHSINM